MHPEHKSSERKEFSFALTREQLQYAIKLREDHKRSDLKVREQAIKDCRNKNKDLISGYASNDYPRMNHMAIYKQISSPHPQRGHFTEKKQSNKAPEIAKYQSAKRGRSLKNFVAQI